MKGCLWVFTSAWCAIGTLIDSVEDATASTVRRSKPSDRGIYDSLPSHAFGTGGMKLAFF